MTRDMAVSAGPLAAQETCQLSRAARLSQDPLILVDGISRAGKSLIGPLLSSFDAVEIERVEEILEYIGALHRLGKITHDAAVAVLRMETDMHLYNSLIGRNVNIRPTDHSGVWRSPTPWKYLARIWKKEGPPVVARARSERPLYQNMTHDQLANFPLHHDAFGERLRMVELVRHPVDLADSWRRRGLGTRYGEDPLIFTFCLRYAGQDLPYYAKGWEECYLASSPADRVIRMIAALWDENQRVTATLTDVQRRAVTFVPLEAFVQRPWPYVEALSEAIGRRPTAATRRMLRRQRCPKPYSLEDHWARKRVLDQQASQECRSVLERLSEEYERLAQEMVARYET